MEEKIFSFMVSCGVDNKHVEDVLESKLEKHHIDLLLGEFIKRYDDLPDVVKERFSDWIVKRNDLAQTIHFNACRESMILCAEEWGIKDKPYPPIPKINIVKRK